MLKTKWVITAAFMSTVLFASCTNQPEELLSICFTGDVLLDRGVRQQIEKKGVDYLFESVTPIFQSCDATVINLECPVTTSTTPIYKKYIFRAEPEWLPALRKAGITHATLANNHSIDQGRSGLIDTYQNLLAVGISSIGYGKNSAEACSPILIQKGDIKVALFSTVTLPLENWSFLEDSPGINQQSIEALKENIQSYKKLYPKNYIVVLLHWGVEYQTNPTPYQRRAAHGIIRSGADAIIGHHPHVIQKEEYFEGKPIFYSLGNFIFDQKKPETSRSLIVELHFTSKEVSIHKIPVNIRSCQAIISR